MANGNDAKTMQNSELLTKSNEQNLEIVVKRHFYYTTNFSDLRAVLILVKQVWNVYIVDSPLTRRSGTR